MGLYVPGYRMLSPTRWTTVASSIRSVIKNYAVLQGPWEETRDIVKDSETSVRISDVHSPMTTFEYIFGVISIEWTNSKSQLQLEQTQAESCSNCIRRSAGCRDNLTLSNAGADSNYWLIWSVWKDMMTLNRKKRSMSLFFDVRERLLLSWRFTQVRGIFLTLLNNIIISNTLSA